MATPFSLPPALSVGFLLLPGFTLTPFATLLDVLRLAADDGDGSRPRRCRWRIVSAGRASVRCSAGTEMAADEGLGDPSRFSHVVVCGGLLRHPPRYPDGYAEWLRAADRAGCTIVALCTGSFLLAEAGLLDGRTACVSWFHQAEFAEEHAGVAVDATRLYAVDGRIVTCAGGTGALDVGAWMVEQQLGHAAARKALDILVVEEARAADSPQPRPSFVGRMADERVRRCALLVEQRLSDPPAPAELAALVGVSPRQLGRLFAAETGMSPGAFVTELRLRYARWLMGGRRTLTAIASECGFADAAHFSRRYRARFGVPPSAERQRGEPVTERRPYG